MKEKDLLKEIEERGYEVGVYDCDTNIFYYYLWRH